MVRREALWWGKSVAMGPEKTGARGRASADEGSARLSGFLGHDEGGLPRGDREMFEVEVSSISPTRYREVLPTERYQAFERGMREGEKLLADRVVWNINSTPRGGGVVELLKPLLAY